MDHNFSVRFLEKFELVKKLGQGGMGCVYLANHKRLDREVAIKAMLHLDERQRRLFKREGQALARLVHPRIVAVHDADEDGVPYLVCEYVPGRSLRDLLEDKDQIPTKRAVELVVQVLEGLDYSHNEGIVHRDIKPENILLTTDGDVKVTDFGLAQIHRESAQGPVSAPGVIAGTPAYMSPEQARGETCTIRSDLYSTGIMLYEMLAGYTPFRAPSAPEVLARHLKELPPHLPSLRADVPDALAAIVTRAVDKDPEKRWGSAAEFRDALLALFPRTKTVNEAKLKTLPGDDAPASYSDAPASKPGSEPGRRRPPMPPLVREVVIMICALCGIWVAGRGPAPKPPPAPSAPAEGVWRASFPYLGETVNITLTIAKDGSYTSEANDPFPYKQEAGRVTFTGDRYELRATSGRADSGGFEATADTLSFKTGNAVYSYQRVR